MSLLSISEIQNCISGKYGLCRYECKKSRCNFSGLHIQECSSFITLDGYNSKIRCHINCHSINVLYFLSCNSCDGGSIYTGKTVNFRQRMNNHITTCHYGTSTNTFDMFYKCSSEKGHVVKEPFFKVYAL